jgi:hypothetical protein
METPPSADSADTPPKGGIHTFDIRILLVLYLLFTIRYSPYVIDPDVPVSSADKLTT